MHAGNTAPAGVSYGRSGSGDDFGTHDPNHDKDGAAAEQAAYEAAEDATSHDPNADKDGPDQQEVTEHQDTAPKQGEGISQDKH